MTVKDDRAWFTISQDRPACLIVTLLIVTGPMIVRRDRFRSVSPLHSSFLRAFSPRPRTGPSFFLTHDTGCV